jgi:hypothetical protein
MTINKEQWNVVKEVLYDYLDQYDHREDVREVLIKMNQQNEV